MTAQILAHTQPLGNTPAPLTFDVAFIERDGEIYFTAEEIGKKLGYSEPSHDIHRIFKKNYSELKRYSVETKVVSTDGKSYNTRAFTEEGMYLITMKAQTPKAAECRALFASVLKKVREQRLELARQSGYAQGLAEGQSAPAVQIAAQKAYLAGLTEGQGEAERLKAAPEALLKLYPKRMQTLKASLRYARMGLSSREIAKLLDGNHRQIGHLLSLARKVGLLPPLASTMLPALPEVTYAG